MRWVDLSLPEKGRQVEKKRRESKVGSRARIHSCRWGKRYDYSWRRGRLQGEKLKRKRYRDGGGREGGGTFEEGFSINWFRN